MMDLELLKRSGEPLERELRERYERRLGVDLGHVRLYTGEAAAALARSRSADALAIGATGVIVLGGAVDRVRSTPAGEALLAHELVHVAQAARHMPLGEDREREACQVEEEVLTGPAAAPSQDPDLIAAVRARVLELVAEAERTLALRGVE
jgi:hypothetical protein